MRSMRSEVSVELTFPRRKRLLLGFVGRIRGGLKRSQFCLLSYGTWKATIIIHDMFNIPGTSKEKSCSLPQITQAFGKSSLTAYRKSEELSVGKHFHFEMCRVIINLAKRTDEAVLLLYVYI